MPIPIIGRSGTGEAQNDRFQLNTVDVDLPAPDRAPEATALYDGPRLEKLLAHPNGFVRGFAIERLARLADAKSHAGLLIPLVDDPEESLASRAIRWLGILEHRPAVDRIAARFQTATGELAGEAASTLGRLDPDRLLEEVKKRSRLDDRAYVQALTALARSEGPAAIDHLTRSMSRAGAMSPERRSALYSAALLSGTSELCARVIGMAISDSRAEEREGEVSAARAALGSLGGLIPALCAQAAGDALLNRLREGLATMSLSLDAAAMEELDEALRKKRIGRALTVLKPLLDREAAPESSTEQSSVIRRRRGVLLALVDQADAIGQLRAEPAAVFFAAALAQADLIAMASSAGKDSPSLVTLGKLLDIDPQAVLAMTPEQLKERFAQEGERRMRQVTGILSNEATHGGELFERLVNAVVAAGGAASIFDAAVGAKQETFTAAALKALGQNPAAAEPVIREVLERRPLEADPTRLALAAAARCGTERLALVVGRRFYELRKIARLATIDAVMQIGDPRLLPLVESRAYPGENEEMVAVVLALLGGAAEEGALAERIEKARKALPSDAFGEIDSGLRLPLRCTRCDEALAYEVQRVYVDPAAKSADGDAIFSGDVACKACGASDTLELTAGANQVLSESLLSLLESRQRGEMVEPRVMPRRIRVGNKEVGLKTALLEADKAVAESPDSIRARLRRARLRLMLWRASAQEDAAKVLELDARSPEALLILGGSLAQRGKVEEGRDRLADAFRALDGGPRLYEADESMIREDIEAALLELEEELDLELPKDLDLGPARERRTAMIEKMAARMAEQQSKLEQQAAAQRRAPPSGAKERPAFVKDE